jgi:flagellar hook-associated protein 3 FlgL
MTRITTVAQNNLTQYYLQLNDNEAQNLNEEISSGYSAQTYSQIAPQAAQLEQYRAQIAQQQSYIDTINTVSTNMQTMQLSMQQVLSEVQSFITNLGNDAYNQTAPTIQTQAETLLQQVASYLNVQVGSSYVFGGTNTSTPPVDLSSLPQGTAASLTNSVGGSPSSGGYYAGGGADAPVQIDSQDSVNYSVTADNPAFEQVIRVLNFIAQSGSFNQDSPTDQANVTLAGQMLANATQSLTNLSGTLALQQSQLSNQETLLQSSLTIAQNGASGIIGVNQATAITQLQTLETQIEASYSATSEIQKLSLVNYLST